MQKKGFMISLPVASFFPIKLEIISIILSTSDNIICYIIRCTLCNCRIFISYSFVHFSLNLCNVISSTWGGGVNKWINDTYENNYIQQKPL